ncbi:MAG: septum formation protein Maf [Clostridia bacterium]|nr:septum formation protein Maf [Clostridia bacterium]
MKLILASQSPRRKEILNSVGLNFEVMPVDADETLPEGIEAADAVTLLARRKAKALLDAHPELSDSVILAADTLVECFGEILGKPEDKEDARRMLTMLCGCGSAVHTGVCIAYKGKFATTLETAYVTFDEMSAEEIEDYISTDEPYDKAGGYAVQGRAALYIAGVTGDWYSVVGLPIHAVKNLLDEEYGIRIKEID